MIICLTLQRQRFWQKETPIYHFLNQGKGARTCSMIHSSSMELYNIIRLPIVGPVKVFSRKAKNAYMIEQDLHKTFEVVQFNQSPTRAILKEVCRVAFFVACWYGLTHYPHIYRDAESVNTIWAGIAFAYFSLFWGEIKIGISRNSDNRLGQIRDDLNSGRTEWFRLPWPCIPVIIFASMFWLGRKTGIAVGVLLTGCLYYFIYYVFGLIH